MTALQAHLKAMERVLSPGDLAKVIATTPETVSRLRGGRRPRRANEVAVLTLHAVIDAALVAMGDDAAAVRDARRQRREPRVQERLPAEELGLHVDHAAARDGGGRGNSEVLHLEDH